MPWTLRACRPGSLELELTESLLLQDSSAVSELLQRLRTLGVSLAIDDFGTGYSNLGYLKRFEVRRLKIDQSFIRRLPVDKHDEAIVRAIIQMANSLQLTTVAEGVESVEVLARLLDMGCTEGQGQHWSAALPAEEFLRPRAPASCCRLGAQVGLKGLVDAVLASRGPACPRRSTLSRRSCSSLPVCSAWARGGPCRRARNPVGYRRTRATRRQECRLQTSLRRATTAKWESRPGSDVDDRRLLGTRLRSRVLAGSRWAAEDHRRHRRIRGDRAQPQGHSLGISLGLSTSHSGAGVNPSGSVSGRCGNQASGHCGGSPQPRW